MKSSLWTIVLVFGIAAAQGQNCEREPKCRITKFQRMKTANCYQKNFRVFPKCIDSDVEIIEMSFNRLHGELTRADLSQFSSLRRLYLSDNLLRSLDDDTFAENSQLETLDLFLNDFSTAPAAAFKLPSLKTLNLGQNPLINLTEDVEKIKPITSPLEDFDINGVMVMTPGELPDLGIMPHLVKYNISGNVLTTLSTKHFAGLCNLEILDSNNVTAKFENLCDCWTLNRWLEERNVKFTAFTCKIIETECSDPVSSRDLKLYSKCSEKLTIIYQSRMWKILIPVSATVAIVALLAVCCCVIRWRRKQKVKSCAGETDPLSGAGVENQMTLAIKA